MIFPPGLKRAAAMVVLRHQSQFLLLKRKNAPNRGRYVPVGGKLKPHEDPYTAARRETLEETGLTPLHLKFGGTLVESSPTDYNWWCSIYLADIPYQAPPACDEGVLEWIDFDQLLSVPTPPTNWHIYDYLLRIQPFAFNAIYDDDLNLLRMTEEISGRTMDLAANI